ncbi:MAG TPA: MopE-related protein, partial [Thermoanaerobaculia bacterium]
SVMSSNRSSDYTLLRLSQAAPAGTAFLTWNNTAVANSNGTPLYRISHPAGAPQAYSAQEVDTSRVTCQSWPRGSWIYSSDTVGATEGGSSGSPVVNAAGEFVGQLSGACGYNVNNPCDAAQNATVDGAFAAYYSSVAQYLGSGASSGDGDGDGYTTAQGDCNDGNAAVNPGAAEVCNDGIDNDCDGFVDSLDSSCQTGGCDLLGVGSSCTSGDQCCSGNCKGKPGAKTCK